ncbi:MAG: histidine phosphatase family protein [Acidimicrobiales bacterium]
MTLPVAEHDAWILRHGATEWSVSGRHTSRTDLPLTDQGRDQAVAVGRALAGRTFRRVLVSPLARARETCELAGFGAQAETTDDLRELDYGDYEGLTTSQIRGTDPTWTVWTGPCPGGEDLDHVAARVDRVIADVRATDGPVALFAHGHVLRVLTARWCELEAVEGRRFPLDTGTVGILGYEHGFPGVRRWNATS